MEGIWTWLKRADARAVFACSVAGLAIVIGWSVWRLVTPSVFTPPVVPPAPAQPESSGLGLLDILARQRSQFTNQTARNPFLLPETMQPSRPEVAVKPPDTQKPSTPDTPVPTPVPPPPPKRETVSLKYHGLMRSAEGTVAALIEDSRTHRSTFYPVGTNIFGLKLASAEPGEVSIVQLDEKPAVIQRGAAVTLETPPHVK